VQVAVFRARESMRRADRLFEIIQLMRRQRLVRARDLAEKLEVSERTIYRDVRDLMASRVPIEGEAGVGYALRQGFDLPPLMFDEHEIEALVLGARIVGSWGDPVLATAAGDVLAKVEAVLPESLRPRVRTMSLMAPPTDRKPEVGFDMALLRRAVREQRKVTIDYTSDKQEHTHRTVWPMALAFFPPVWLLMGWCELRQDFRSFRVDRVDTMSFDEERYPQTPGRRLVDYLQREGRV
jgi:predicted DNA-binding transcriptional regulator YafY